MQLIILPLTVRETDTQQALLKKAIHLAKELTNEYQQVFALSGIVTFSDKIIDKEYAANIRRWIQMTKVGRIIEMEKEEAVKRATQEMQKQLRMEKRRAKTAEKNAKTAETKAKTAELKVCILQMLLKGNTISEAAEKLHMKASDVAALIAE